MPASTRSSSSRRVSARNTSRRSESSDTLTRFSPAATRSCAELGELHAVGREREVDAQRREQLDEPNDVGPDERLAAREPDRLEPELLDADPSDAGDLLVGEELVTGQPVHALLGHAVRAAEVAAVGDRDAQITHATGVGIDQRDRECGATHVVSVEAPGRGLCSRFCGLQFVAPGSGSL